MWRLRLNNPLFRSRPAFPLQLKSGVYGRNGWQNAFPCGADLGKFMLLYFDAWSASLMLLYLSGEVRLDVSGRYLILRASLLIY